MNDISKYRNVLKELVRLRFQRLMMFRISFFGPFFVDGSLFLIQLLVFQAVYSKVDRIGSWGRGEMILFIGTFSLINAVNMVVWFFGVNSLGNKIKSGQMDLYLTKPISPLFRISLEEINPGAIPLILLSILIIVYGINVADIRLNLGRILIYCFWLILMMLLFYELEVLVRSISFYVVSTAKMQQLEDAGLSLCMNLPGIAFYGVFKIIFYCILPYAVLATLPVQSIVGEMTVKIAFHGILVVCAFSLLTRIVWKNGIRHYNSASS